VETTTAVEAAARAHGMTTTTALRQARSWCENESDYN
jgi:nucleotidyltransferase/DNA polymerase involved in DNA repair